LCLLQTKEKTTPDFIEEGGENGLSENLDIAG
jgi:hypothetical protein